MTSITRVAFCDKCHKANRPQVGDDFVVIGRTKEIFQLHTVEKRKAVNRGFTPHLFTILKIEGDNVLYTCLCLMDNCAMTIIESTKAQTFEMHFHTDTTVKSMSKKDWNALVQFTDRDYFLDKKWR